MTIFGVEDEKLFKVLAHPRYNIARHIRVLNVTERAWWSYSEDLAPGIMRMDGLQEFASRGACGTMPNIIIALSHLPALQKIRMSATKNVGVTLRSTVPQSLCAKPMPSTHTQFCFSWETEWPLTDIYLQFLQDMVKTHSSTLRQLSLAIRPDTTSEIRRPILSSNTFPQLKRLRISVSTVPHDLPARIPRVWFLDIADPYESTDVLSVPSNSLPNIHHVRCMSSRLPEVCRTMPNIEVVELDQSKLPVDLEYRLGTYENSAEWDNTFVTNLSSLRTLRTPIRKLSIFVTTLEAAELSRVAPYLVGLEELMLQSWGISDLQLLRDNASSFPGYISTLQVLAFYQCLRTEWVTHGLLATIEFQKDLRDTWYQYCPALRKVMFCYSTDLTWIREGDKWVEHPISGSRDL